MFSTIVLAGVAIWVVVGIVLIANGYFVYQVRIARYRVMQTLADKGQPVPPELFTGVLRQAPVGLLRGGIVMTCLGLALGIFLWAMTAQSVFAGPIDNLGWLPTVAFFPIMVGVALLLMAMVDRRRLP
ncbi:MAG TPA: DUF6249 domain-containing protein [Rhizomicrobium sp.]|jgi:hypothetical protein|nr:DUF6249 domain-containing protein [Rhizomicrobium sp.]